MLSRSFFIESSNFDIFSVYSIVLEPPILVLRDTEKVNMKSKTFFHPTPATNTRGLHFNLTEPIFTLVLSSNILPDPLQLLNESPACPKNPSKSKPKSLT